jgi:hypothetical protein
LLQQLRKNWGELDITVDEELGLLGTLGTIRVQLTRADSKTPSIIVNRVPEPREDIRQLFQLANIPCRKYYQHTDQQHQIPEEK